MSLRLARRRALAMDEHALLLRADGVLLHLRDVVTDVVHGRQRRAEHAIEDLARPVRHHLAIDERVVRRRRHRAVRYVLASSPLCTGAQQSCRLDELAFYSS